MKKGEILGEELGPTVTSSACVGYNRQMNSRACWRGSRGKTFSSVPSLNLVARGFALWLGFGAITVNVRAAEPLDRQIGQVLEAAHRDGKFNGTALVVRRGQTLYERSFGLADQERSVPNTADTRFLAFSVLKPMTAVLVFQQIDAGKLKLADTLATFFPNLAGKPAGRISVQQLLTHTSGISEAISAHPDRRITAVDLEAATVKARAGFEYSNTGYVCLGLVLEKVAGQTYEALIREKIFEPAGMKDSGVLRSGVVVPGLARGYRRNSGQLVPTELGVVPEALDGAGSLYTTARDLGRFDAALANDKLLSRKTQDLMVSQQIKGQYGYGWFLSEQGGKYFPWHKGDYRGYAAVLVRQIHRQEAIVILANIEETDVLGLRTKILQALKANPGP